MKDRLIVIISLIVAGLLVILASCTSTHQHEYFDIYKYDNENHWQESMCGHGNSLKEKHNLTIVETLNPTYEADGYTKYKCVTCNYTKKDLIKKLEHNYSSELSFDDYSHWYPCTDLGYESLKKDEQAHEDSNEVVITPSTETTVGLGEYTCSICNHTYQKAILIKTNVLESPIVNNEIIYIGQTLECIELVGGLGSVEGEFKFTNPSEIITESKEYNITFYPTESEKYDTVESTIYIEATQLYVEVVSYENGEVSPTGIVNVNYNGSVELDITPNLGYQVSKIIVDGIESTYSSNYILDGIKEYKKIEVYFEEKPALPFTLECLTGNNNCYSYINDTLYFNTITENTSYYISGVLEGNIVIDVGDDFDFELELQGFTLTSSNVCPITILSGNEVSISAKKDNVNYIYDNREAVASDSLVDYSASIYSLVDLKIKGKGSLNIESKNNNGIHSKKDLDVKNLTLEINCNDNALKGNDSVTIENASTTLIAKAGDTIKTTNSDISDKGNQRGTITIIGGIHNLYAACDAIDAAYDVVINDSSTILNIFTDKYSQYSTDVTVSSNESYYVRYSQNSYKYSVKYYNSDTDYAWVNAQYYTSVSGGRSTYYYYKFDKLSNYDKFAVYMYTSSQEETQETDYYATTGYLSINDSYDTIAFTNRMGSLSYNWTSYSASSSGGMMPGGMQEGNSDKGEYSTKGLKSANQIIINDGNISIKAYDDAIHANCDSALENNETPLGNVTINGGSITIYSNDDGIHADGILLINNGNINITNSYEGLEGQNVEIQGGNISVISNDDGINSGATSGQGIKILGGTLYIYAKGDGIDSNSKESYNAISFAGGNTIVICNSNGNSAIDSDGGYSYTGGYVLAIMTNGGMTSESTHCSNISTIGKTTTLSLSSYCVVDNIVTVKMPTSMSAFVVLLGSNNASITSGSSTSYTLDSNGVYWN